VQARHTRVVPPLSLPMRYIVATAYTTSFSIGAIDLTLSLQTPPFGWCTTAPPRLPMRDSLKTCTQRPRVWDTRITLIDPSKWGIPVNDGNGNITSALVIADIPPQLNNSGHELAGALRESGEQYRMPTMESGTMPSYDGPARPGCQLECRRRTNENLFS
jgi:hypothetical protein